MKHKISTNHENGNNAAAIWWKRLSPLKKELFESKYGIIDNQKINEIYKIHTDWSSEDLEENAEENYSATSISVLKYITVLEEQAEQLRKHAVSKCEGLQGEALLLAYGKFLSEECSLISPDMENHKPYIRKFLSQQ